MQPTGLLERNCSARTLRQISAAMTGEEGGAPPRKANNRGGSSPPFQEVRCLGRLTSRRHAIPEGGECNQPGLLEQQRSADKVSNKGDDGPCNVRVLSILAAFVTATTLHMNVRSFGVQNAPIVNHSPHVRSGRNTKTIS